MKSPNPLGLIVAFLIAVGLFGGLELAVRKGWLGRRERDLDPRFARRKRSFRELVQDVLYWTVAPLLSRNFVRIGVGIVLVLAAWHFGRGEAGVKGMLAFFQAHSPISRLPFVLELLLGLFVGDFMGYWSHRLFHRGRLWRFHAVHHSSETLDWLAASRVHPVNELVTSLAHVVPLVVLGFDPMVFASVEPILIAYAVFIHADVPWDFGPLRYVIASPRFHRWHHTSAEEGRDKNFAGLFPLWDIVFRTFYMPAHEPTLFGADAKVPTGIIAQLIWPFRRSPPQKEPPSLITAPSGPSAAG
jgi:sterol desaturase/sphingolipid hydroxylase (fatty acid hydroxylase superfamily)